MEFVNSHEICESVQFDLDNAHFALKALSTSAEGQQLWRPPASPVPRPREQPSLRRLRLACVGLLLPLPASRSLSTGDLRVSSGRRTLSLDQNLRALSIRAEAEPGDSDLAEPVPPTPPTPAPRKKSRVSVKSGRKQRVVLRFLWLEKNIGISLDQVVPGHRIIPLSLYFFWPRKDAWEELKAKLDSKKWISRKTTIILLNQATDIINLWQQNATNLV